MRTNQVLKLSAPATREYWEIGILFEDDHLLVLDKPSRLLTSPDRYDPTRPNLMGLLHRDIARNAPWAAQRAITYLFNAHRLDFETSGILLLAKNKSALIHLANQFGSEKPFKSYVALLQGVPGARTFDVLDSIAPHPLRPGFMRIDPKGGKKSATSFEIVQVFRGFSEVRCLPKTGRTHQIRVHAKHAGFPIVGDSLYGGQPLYLSELKPGYRQKADQLERPLMGRVALHAEKLEFKHPATEQSVSVESPRPKDLEVALKYLQKFAS